MDETSYAKIPLHFGSIKVRVHDGRESEVQREMSARAVTSLLWVALKQAQDAGLDESIVDGIGRVHLQAVRLQHGVAA
jgi:hypothetical protein